MRSEWENIRLCDTPIDIIDGDRGKNYPNGSDFSSSGYCLFLNAKNVTASGFSFEQTTFISKKKDELLRKGKLKRKDVVLTTRGTVGNVAYYDDKVDFKNLRINSGMVILRSDCGIVDSTYMYWLFRSPIIQEQIAQVRTGSAQPQLPISIMRNLEFMLPPLPEQKAIAAVLSALDDKIELNNRINQKLEEMAQAIFKSWFVDFEPFQDGEFVESELGPIPKGWRVGTLGELVAVKYGKDHKKLSNGLIPTFGSGGIMRYVEKPLYSGESVLIPRKGTLNNVTYINEPFWTVDTMFYTEMRMKNIAKFIYFFVSSNDLAAMNSGSAVPSMTVDILNNLKVVIPYQGNFDEFESAVSSLFLQQQCLAKENQQLASLRDALLPKLMSGELRVPCDTE